MDAGLEKVLDDFEDARQHASTMGAGLMVRLIDEDLRKCCRSNPRLAELRRGRTLMPAASIPAIQDVETQ